MDLKTLPEATSSSFEADLVSRTGAAIAGSSLDSAVFSLYSADTGAIINSRSSVDILSDIDEDGHLILELNPSDLALIDRAHVNEQRELVIEIAYNSGADGVRTAFQFEVRRQGPQTS